MALVETHSEKPVPEGRPYVGVVEGAKAGPMIHFCGDDFEGHDVSMMLSLGGARDLSNAIRWAIDIAVKS
jgi:hypothetical protein